MRRPELDQNGFPTSVPNHVGGRRLKNVIKMKPSELLISVEVVSGSDNECRTQYGHVRQASTAMQSNVYAKTYEPMNLAERAVITVEFRGP